VHDTYARTLIMAIHELLNTW